MDIYITEVSLHDGAVRHAGNTLHFENCKITYALQTLFFLYFLPAVPHEVYDLDLQG